MDDSGPTDDSAGRLEVFFRGEWGTVCDDRFTSETFTLYGPNNTIQTDDVIVENIAPQLACQLMGYTTGEVVLRGGMSIAPASQPIWLDDVRCAAGSTHWTGSPPTGLQHCYHAGVSLHNCTHEEDVHLSCFGSSTARAAFSGEFQNVPESHDGTEFTFQAAFSEVVTASAEDLRDHAFDVTGGTVTEVSPVDGRRDLWSVTVSPVSSGDVTITLDGERACDTPGAVCAEDGAQLTNTVSVEIPGTPVTDDGITARFEDVPPQHDGETPFTLRLALSAPVRNSYTAMRENVLEATGGTVTRARRIDGRSDLWEITITPLGEGNVQIGLAAGRACGTHGALCTRDGRGLATGLMTLVPGPSTIGPRSPGPAPLTARFANLPVEHDGATAFTLEIVFSEAPSGMKNRTLRNALSVTGGAVTRVRRVNSDRAHRIVTIRPDGWEAVDIALPASPDCEATGAICTEAGGRLEAGLLTRVRGPAALRVADAEVEEAANATLAFAVTLDRAPSGTVTVDYATSDGTATAGSDYTAASGTLTFAAGERSKTVSVAVLDDAHDEGSETLTLTLSNPSGAYVADGTATGTINNSDAMPGAWMARFGRTVADQVLDAVTDRMAAPRTAATEVNLAGYRIGSSVSSDGHTNHAWQERDELETQKITRGITSREMLTGSSFLLSAGSAEDGLGALWGRGAVSSFDGREGEVGMDGEVVSGLVGADWTHGRTTLGLAMAHSRGEGAYRGPTGDGEIETTLTGLYPWGRHELNDRLSVWGVAGYGAGTLTLTPEGLAPMETDTDLAMASVGARGVVRQPPAGIGLELAVRSDALVVRTGTDRINGVGGTIGNLAATESDVTRLRLGLEGTWRGGFITPFLVPSFEIGVRHDGGDAETGFGSEVGMGFTWTDPARGIGAEFHARGLLSHEDGEFRERGLSGALFWDPDPDSDLGWSFGLAQTMGAQATGGMDALLNPGTTRVFDIGNSSNTTNSTNDDDLDQRRLEANLGYGMAMFDGRYTGTPVLGLGLTEDGRETVLGWRLAESRSSGLVFGLDVEVRRSESVDGEPGRRLGFGFGWQMMGERSEDLDFRIRFGGERIEAADAEPEHRFGVQMSVHW